MPGDSKLLGNSPLRALMQLVVLYAVAIPFLGFMIQRNETVGWVAFGLSFLVFSYLMIDQLSRYTNTPSTPSREKRAEDEVLNPLTRLTELTRLALNAPNIYTSELFLDRVRRAFMTKVRLSLDLSPTEMRKLISDRRALINLIRDEELASLLLGNLAEHARRRPVRAEQLVGKIEAWTP